MKRDQVNWNEPPLERWMSEITRASTKKIYRTAWRAYAEYTGKTSVELLDEAIEDAKRDPRERKGILKSRILGFYNWLCKEYPVYSRGAGEHTEVRKGVRPKTANSWVNAVRSFYSVFEIVVKLEGRSALPHPRVYNKRPQLTIMDVKKLVDHARTPRDRAIILTLFQGGMDASTLCSMKYGDIAEGLKKEEHPLKVVLFREKTGIEYYTFLGRDSVESIEAYLNDASSRGVKFGHNTPLFVKEVGQGEPMDTYLVQKVLREVAMRSGLVDEENNGKDMNPVNPHALRESFGSIMTNNGVPDTLVDFWLGHAIGEMAEAYKGVRFEEVKRMYAERERFISISVPESEAIEQLRRESEEKASQLRENFDQLYSENIELRKTIRDIRGILEKRDVTQEEMKYVLSVLMKVGLAIPNVKPPVNIKELSDEEFEKLMKAEQEKFDKEMDKAMKIIEGWKRK